MKFLHLFSVISLASLASVSAYQAHETLVFRSGSEKKADDFGYSSMAILPDGNLGLLSERKADPTTLLDIVFTSIPLS